MKSWKSTIKLLQISDWKSTWEWATGDGYLACDVVDESFHTWFHTERMLTRQQLGIAVAIQADGTRQQLIKLLHFCWKVLIQIQNLLLISLAIQFTE